MPTVVDGQRGIGGNDGVLAARVVKDVHSKIMDLEPDKAPLTLLSRMASTKAVHQPVFDVHEDDLIPNLDRANGAQTASSTTIDVDNGTYWFPNSLGKVQRTNETFLVTSISTNALTVVRSNGSTAAAAILDNDQLTIIGPAALEGASIEAAKSTLVTEVTNYTEIFRWPVALVGTLAASELYGGKEMARLHRTSGIMHAVQIELANLFGEQAQITSGDTTRRSTGGIIPFISTNSTDYGGTWNFNTFSSDTETMFRYGRKKKVMFAARGVVTSIDQEAFSNTERMESSVTFGITTSRLRTTHGELNLITHNKLEGDTYGGYAVVVDMDNMGVRFLRGRDTKLRTDVGTPGDDAQTDEWLSEMGLWRSLEKTHSLLTNAA